ncbi:MAG: phosphoglucosamine mutase [Acidimicrobiia bacterium]|nr:phosphoglucosamine mutase [Acidimicrobiia bacterium]
MAPAGTRLFGTDGVRGVANVELTPHLALDLGRAAGSLLANGPVVVGRDTRRSGEMLSMAVQAGFQSVGIDTIDVGVMPSGGISHLTHHSSAEMGVIVSASHNPAADNGVKFLDKLGSKLNDADEERIEAKVRTPGTSVTPIGGGVGTRLRMNDALDRYVADLAKDAAYSFTGIDLTLDCAHGAAYQAAPALFEALKADVEVIGASPTGLNINESCGATHPTVVAKAADGRIGLAFDGDADRLIASDEKGRIVDGDRIMAIIARHWQRGGKLKNGIVVTTVMANLGFMRSMEQAGIEVVTTKVGDRYVLEAMHERKAMLGGEQSGHVIFLDRGRTGDGLLTGIRLLEVVAGTGRSLAELSDEAMVTYPQRLVNVRVERKERLDGASEIWSEVADVESELGADGRVLIRASGTEPLVRVMVEASRAADAERYAERLADSVREALGSGREE